MQKTHINETKILEDTFNFNNRERKQVFTRFQEGLCFHCFQSKIGRMKQSDPCKNWFHEDCEDFNNEDQTETVDEKRFWFCRYCIGINRLPGKMLDTIFVNLCFDKKKCTMKTTVLRISVYTVKVKKTKVTSKQNLEYFKMINRRLFKFCNNSKLLLSSSWAILLEHLCFPLHQGPTFLCLSTCVSRFY